MAALTQRRGGGRRITVEELKALGSAGDRRRTRMGDLQADFVASCRLANLREETVKWYVGHLSRFWGDPEQLTSEVITVEYIRRGMLEMIESGLKPQTVNGAIRTVKRFIGWAKLEGSCLEADALDLTRIPYLKEDKERPRVLEVEEIERLLAAPNTQTVAGPRDRAMIALMSDSGLRVGELTRLLLEDVRTSPPTVTVRGSASKSRRTRTVAMSEVMVSYMEQWLKVRQESVPAECPWLFPSLMTYTPLERHSVNHFLARYAKKAGVARPIGPHCFRRTFATEALRDGASQRSVQDTMGHRTIVMTQYYAQLGDQDAWQATTEHSPLLKMNEANSRG